MLLFFKNSFPSLSDTFSEARENGERRKKEGREGERGEIERKGGSKGDGIAHYVLRMKKIRGFNYFHSTVPLPVSLYVTYILVVFASFCRIRIINLSASVNSDRFGHPK